MRVEHLFVPELFKHLNQSWTRLIEDDVVVEFRNYWSWFYWLLYSGEEAYTIDDWDSRLLGPAELSKSVEDGWMHICLEELKAVGS